MSESKSQHQRKEGEPQYTLLYHPGIPGRGEYIRLAFEAAQVPYSDPANEDKNRKHEVYSKIDPKFTGSNGSPPPLAPPMLQISGAGKNNSDLLISQTPNILLYLGPKLGLAGSNETDLYHINQLALTALDLSNEAHDTHHPVEMAAYYEEQKEESLRYSKQFRELRVPKYFGYFERVLKGNEGSGEGRYLVGGKLTWADTTLWQVLDGLHFAFPKECAAIQDKYLLLMGKFYPGIMEEKGLKEYINSGKRLKFSQGLFRNYPELDRQD
ncbi:glutathione S-transferase protein-like protein [Tothia fuscella]|uniref:Glutathione S-transferase protein-like protein n=1 Tax=Tothia fuscella TaxID=1048955 RepID=A0A9P4NI43_9PEZI|nr:glutathione S-transferase protein-like protein [Tothia fuscella]